MVVYDLWDVETGNMISTFESEEVALKLVTDLLECNGLDYAGALDLGYLDEHGEVHSLATGAALVDRVRTTASQPLAATAGLRNP